MKLISSDMFIRQIEKKLNKLNISLSLIDSADWKSIYKLLKLARKVDDEFNLPRKELKLMAKALVELNEENFIAKELITLINVNVEIEKSKFDEETSWDKLNESLPFVDWFFDKKSVLLF